MGVWNTRAHGTPGQKAIHRVSAFVHGLGVTLGQVKTAEKSNEIMVLPELLDALSLKRTFIRGHWLGGCGPGEDQARMREGDSAENFSILRRVALNLLTQDKSTEVGVKNRRLLAGWNDKCREEMPGLQALA